MIPDKDTKERIKNLATVGRVIVESSHDNSEETDYYLAQEALNRFEQGIDELELDHESKEGMKSLVSYLRGKIERRMNNYIK